MHSTVRLAVQSPIFWLLNLVALAAIGSNLTAGDGEQSGKSANLAVREPGQMLREGARVESRIMTVRLAGESLTLEAEDNRQSFEALENLALERIVQAVRADSSDRRWLVTGVVTEYRGRNFLLLERTSRAPRSTQQ